MFSRYASFHRNFSLNLKFLVQEEMSNELIRGKWNFGENSYVSAEFKWICYLPSKKFSLFHSVSRYFKNLFWKYIYYYKNFYFVNWCILSRITPIYATFPLKEKILPVLIKQWTFLVRWNSVKFYSTFNIESVNTI